jgi:hypothetical protein
MWRATPTMAVGQNVAVGQRTQQHTVVSVTIAHKNKQAKEVFIVTQAHRVSADAAPFPLARGPT